MAEKEVILELTNTDWLLIEVDPDADGYTDMIVQQNNTQHLDTRWSTVNTIPNKDAVRIPNPLLVNYDIYINNSIASPIKPLKFTVKRM